MKLSNSSIIFILVTAWGILLIIWIGGILVQRRDVINKRLTGGEPWWRGFLSATITFLLLVIYMIKNHLVKKLNFSSFWSMVVSDIGLLFLFMGLIFAIWARITIGSHWMMGPVCMENQKIIKSGPYALVRHPIYISVILMLVGSSAMIQNIYSLLISFFGSFILVGKALLEERSLIKYRGEEYLPYIRKTSMFFPCTRVKK